MGQQKELFAESNKAPHQFCYNLVSQKDGGATHWDDIICVTYMITWPTVKPLIKNGSMLHSVVL